MLQGYIDIALFCIALVLTICIVINYWEWPLVITSIVIAMPLTIYALYLVGSGSYFLFGGHLSDDLHKAVLTQGVTLGLVSFAAFSCKGTAK
ncbi:hypothetical protein [Nitrospirillum amazonense]|uniref:hypothetical protein n=1 Tax=Nitrospirillum amazonense TaxID=28077 RepID=UPI002412E55D|nr:hypothetical protein [Nitrospirillum amazonense]MDG3444525.1 hypothetical protein [Nitrospirillum amazonense]